MWKEAVKVYSKTISLRGTLQHLRAGQLGPNLRVVSVIVRPRTT